MNLTIKAGAVVYINRKRIKWIESLTHLLCHTKADKTKCSQALDKTFCNLKYGNFFHSPRNHLLGYSLEVF